MAARIYFAGMNGSMTAAALEGQDVLISFADIATRPGVWAREIRPRLERRAYRSAILDSGAFTELTQRARNERARAAGKKIPHPTPWHTDLEAYGRFALEFGHLFDEIVTLDDIEGDVELTRRNTDHLEALGLTVVPVFHQGEPWDVLEDLVARYDRIGLGVQRVKGNPAAGAFEWTAEAVARIPSSVSIHGFGMTRFAKRLPIATTDSTTWIAEFRALRKASGSTHYCAHQAVVSMSDWSRMVLVVRSYSEPSRAIVRTIPDQVAKGQGRTVLARFSPSSFRAALEACGEAAGRRAA